MRIRKATGDDAPALARLLGELGYPTDADELVDRLERYETKGAGRVLAVVDGDQVVAFAAVELRYPIHHASPTGYVSSLAVSSTCRRRGVGGLLLSGVEAFARDAGCSRVVVTSAEHRADAHAFYPARGWRQTGRRFEKELDRGRDAASPAIALGRARRDGG